MNSPYIIKIFKLTFNIVKILINYGDHTDALEEFPVGREVLSAKRMEFLTNCKHFKLLVHILHADGTKWSEIDINCIWKVSVVKIPHENDEWATKMRVGCFRYEEWNYMPTREQMEFGWNLMVLN